MYTLRDALRVLVRFGVKPEEIEIPREIYAFIARQAREISEEEADEAEVEDELY